MSWAVCWCSDMHEQLGYNVWGFDSHRTECKWVFKFRLWVHSFIDSGSSDSIVPFENTTLTNLISLLCILLFWPRLIQVAWTSQCSHTEHFKQKMVKCRDTMLIFLVVCEKIHVSCSKCWCSCLYQLRIYLWWSNFVIIAISDFAMNAFL